MLKWLKERLLTLLFPRVTNKLLNVACSSRVARVQPLLCSGLGWTDRKLTSEQRFHRSVLLTTKQKRSVMMTTASVIGSYFGVVFFFSWHSFCSAREQDTTESALPPNPLRPEAELVESKCKKSGTSKKCDPICIASRGREMINSSMYRSTCLLTFSRRLAYVGF